MTECAWLRPSADGKVSTKATPLPLIAPLMLKREHTPVTEVHAGAKKFEMPDSWPSSSIETDEAQPLAPQAAPARESAATSTRCRPHFLIGALFVDNAADVTPRIARCSRSG